MLMPKLALPQPLTGSLAHLLFLGDPYVSFAGSYITA